MATHSSILAWKIPWTEESAGLYSMGLQRVSHNWATLTFTANWGEVMLWKQATVNSQLLNSSEIIWFLSSAYQEFGLFSAPCHLHPNIRLTEWLLLEHCWAQSRGEKLQTVSFKVWLRGNLNVSVVCFTFHIWVQQRGGEYTSLKRGVHSEVEIQERSHKYMGQ